MHPRLVLWSAVESGKSSALAIARPLWLLGRDPSLRVAIVSNTFSQSSKLLRAIARHVEQSAELHAVFPRLKAGSPWTDSAITVARPTVSKDPSVQAFGLGGAVIGSRIDLLIVDDALDFESTRTEEQRQKTWDWFHSSLSGRLTERGRIIVAGVGWHPEDLMHRLSRQPGWHGARFPVEKEDGSGPWWPERWSPARIEAKRLELGPAESARQLDCLARSDAEARFKADWIGLALSRGSGKTLAETLYSLPPGYRVVHGVDLAVSKKLTADLSAIASVLVHPDGSRQLIALRSGHWNGPEILDHVRNVWRRYGGVVCVESVAAQALLSHFLRATDDRSPVVDFKTGRGEKSLEWQAERLAAELERGQWMFPSDDGRVNNSEVGHLVRDLLYFVPSAHCPDRLASLLFARWLADGASSGEVEFGHIDLMAR